VPCGSSMSLLRVDRWIRTCDVRSPLAMVIVVDVVAILYRNSDHTKPPYNPLDFANMQRNITSSKSSSHAEVGQLFLRRTRQAKPRIPVRSHASQMCAVAEV